MEWCLVGDDVTTVPGDGHTAGSEALRDGGETGAGTRAGSVAVVYEVTETRRKYKA